MSFNGSGTFSRPVASYVFDTVISETDVNTEMDGIATGLSNCITKDGQQTVSANIPMNSKKFTVLGAGADAGDSANLGQIQAQAYIWCGTMTGTADAGVLAPSPAITAYAAGQTFRWKASANSNTGAMTISISGLTTIAAQTDLAALSAGDHEANKIYQGTLDTTGTIQIMKIANDASAGDVVGPASATDSAVALFNGTTGKLLKDGVVLGTSSGNIPQVGTKSASTTLAGLVEQSTSAENVAGTDDTVFPSVAGTKEMIDTHATTQGTPVATTSGTSIDFTSIPAGTKRIVISLSGVSTTGASLYMIQIGDAGGVETSGYSGLCEGVVMSGGFTINDSVALSNQWQGVIILTLLDASTFTWSMSGDLARLDAGTVASSAGAKSLTAELDRIRLTTVGGTDTFDAGKMNIQYEG